MKVKTVHAYFYSDTTEAKLLQTFMQTARQFLKQLINSTKDMAFLIFYASIAVECFVQLYVTLQLISKKYFRVAFPQD